jgi:splicing factor 3B subunit 4
MAVAERNQGKFKFNKNKIQILLLFNFLNSDATIYVGGLDEKVSETILWELFVQAGPVVNVHMPKDRITQNHQGYGFVEFMTEEDADYAIKIMNMIKLYGKPIRVNKVSLLYPTNVQFGFRFILLILFKASAHQKNLDIGANLFIGNLDPEVDEKLLYDTFSAFGVILQVPKVFLFFFCSLILFRVVLEFKAYFLIFIYFFVL